MQIRHKVSIPSRQLYIDMQPVQAEPTGATVRHIVRLEKQNIHPTSRIAEVILNSAGLMNLVLDPDWTIHIKTVFTID